MIIIKKDMIKTKVKIKEDIKMIIIIKKHNKEEKMIIIIKKHSKEVMVILEDKRHHLFFFFIYLFAKLSDFFAKFIVPYNDKLFLPELLSVMYDLAVLKLSFDSNLLFLFIVWFMDILLHEN